MRISCDASVRDGFAGVAGIRKGGGVENGRILFMDVVPLSSSGEAERYAVECAMDIALKHRWKHVTFLTDLKGLKVKKQMLPGWRVHTIPRRSNVQAHCAARRALGLWRRFCEMSAERVTVPA